MPTGSRWNPALGFTSSRPGSTVPSIGAAVLDQLPAGMRRSACHDVLPRGMAEFIAALRRNRGKS
jgi:hypothetical protein